MHWIFRLSCVVPSVFLWEFLPPLTDRSPPIRRDSLSSKPQASLKEGAAGAAPSFKQPKPKFCYIIYIVVEYGNSTTSGEEA